MERYRMGWDGVGGWMDRMGWNGMDGWNGWMGRDGCMDGWMDGRYRTKTIRQIFEIPNLFSSFVNSLPFACRTVSCEIVSKTGILTFTEDTLAILVCTRPF